jgi:hypothetical protein
MIKRIVFGLLLLAINNQSFSETFSKVTEGNFNPAKMYEYDYNLHNDSLCYNLSEFEISSIITVKDYKKYLAHLKKTKKIKRSIDYFKNSYNGPIIFIEFLLKEKKAENLPMIGLSWLQCVQYCIWKSKQDFKNQDSVFYRLPHAGELYAAKIRSGIIYDEMGEGNSKESWENDSTFNSVPLYTINFPINELGGFLEGKFNSDVHHHLFCFMPEIKNYVEQVKIFGNNLNMFKLNFPGEIHQILANKGYFFIGFRIIKTTIEHENHIAREIWKIDPKKWKKTLKDEIFELENL